MRLSHLQVALKPDWTKIDIKKLEWNQSSSVIRQKYKSQNECYKKTKHTTFSEKRTFRTPRFFFGKFSVLCFLLTPVFRLALLPYCRQVDSLQVLNNDYLGKFLGIIYLVCTFSKIWPLPRLYVNFRIWGPIQNVSQALFDDVLRYFLNPCEFPNYV